LSVVDAGTRIADVERLLETLDQLPDRVARETATSVLQALLDLYGEGLARLTDHIAAHDADGAIAEAAAADQLVSHLQLLHGLHPVALEVRVRSALDSVRPYMEQHGGDVELLGVEDGVVRLRMEGSCHGCPSSRVTLKHAIEEAIFKEAPDVERIEAEGVDAPPAQEGLLKIELACPLPMAPAAGA
jgi:Fe-S cluster biogenesis protein NfuA